MIIALDQRQNKMNKFIYPLLVISAVLYERIITGDGVLWPLAVVSAIGLILVITNLSKAIGNGHE